VLNFKRLLLLLALAMQDSQAELQVADLAIITLALLIQTSVLSAKCGKFLCLCRFSCCIVSVVFDCVVLVVSRHYHFGDSLLR